MNGARIIEILEGGGQERPVVREQAIQMHAPDAGGVNLVEAPYPRDLYGNFTVDPLRVDTRRYELKEAATGRMSVPNFPDLLRAGVRFDVFSGYNEAPMIYPRLVNTMSSNETQEEYAFDAGLGQAPVVAEGQAYPKVTATIGGSLIIVNQKRGFIIEVTEELMRFDKWGKVRDLSANIGRAMRMTREQAVIDVLTNTGNYNSVRNNNDQNTSNQQAWAFSPVNLNKAMAIVHTQRDKTSGQLLGAQASVLVVGPLLEMAARQLIYSPQMMRVGGGTNEVYGGGTNNPFFGVVSQVIVSPQFSNSYDWALIDPNRALVFQLVDDLRVENEGTSMMSESWLTRDTVRYKARDWYGVGMRDDRFAFYSKTDTEPILA